MKNPSCYPDYDYFCLAISAVVGNLFLIIIIGVPILLFFVIRHWIKNKPEPEPEPEPETSSLVFFIFKIIIVYIVIVIGFIFFEIDDTNIGYIVVELPLSILWTIFADFIFPIFEWLFQER